MKENTEWDVLAAVMLREVETGGSEQREILWQGPPVEAVCYFMNMPENERENAEMVVAHEAGTRNTWLSHTDVETLALRPDYPNR